MKSCTVVIQGGSNMTGTDLCVNKPHCTAAAQCGLFTYKSVPVIFEPPCNISMNSFYNEKFFFQKVQRKSKYTF